MTAAEMLTVGGEVLVFLTALVACVQGFINRAAIHEVHLTINSRLTEFKLQADHLRETMVTAARAEGVLQGRNEAKNGRPTDSTA